MAQEIDEKSKQDDEKNEDFIIPNYSSSVVVVESISDTDSDFSNKHDAKILNDESVLNSATSVNTIQIAKRQTDKSCEANSQIVATELSSSAVILESESDTEIESESDYSDNNNANVVPSEAMTYPGVGPLQNIEACRSFGNIHVADSNDVHVGNKTYIHGPVTIKHFVQVKTPDNVETAGFSNQSFVSTASDINSLNLNVRPPLHQGDHNWKCKGVLWIERRWGLDIKCKTLLLSLFCIAITTSICIMFVIFLERTKTPTVLAPSLNKVPFISSSDSDRLQGCWYIDYPTSLLLSVGSLMVCCAILTLVFWTWAFRNPETGFINTKEQGYIQKGVNNIPLIQSHILRMVERKQWLAQPPNAVLDRLSTPVPYVIITHTATEGCFNESECIFHVRCIQSFHIESRKWNDIGYNFLVGGDGSAYEGRGWNYVGAHTKGYNFKSIGIALIGTFTVMDPPERQYIAAKRLIELGVALRIIAKDYKLYAHRQLMPTASPGDHVFTELQKWPHYSTDTPVM